MLVLGLKEEASSILLLSAQWRDVGSMILGTRSLGDGGQVCHLCLPHPSTVKREPLVSPWSKTFLIDSKVESPLTSHVSFVESQNT